MQATIKGHSKMCNNKGTINCKVKRKRSWIQFPGNTHTDKTFIAFKSLWIKASAKCFFLCYLYQDLRNSHYQPLITIIPLSLPLPSIISPFVSPFYTTLLSLSLPHQTLPWLLSKFQILSGSQKALRQSLTSSSHDTHTEWDFVLILFSLPFPPWSLALNSTAKENRSLSFSQNSAYHNWRVFLKHTQQKPNPSEIPPPTLPQ